MRQTSSQNGNTPVVMTQLIYSGNEIAISYPNEIPAIQRNIKFQLDGQGHPVKRIYSNEMNLPSANGPQKNVDTAITDYEYDANGYVTRFTGISKDSLSYYGQPGVLETSMDVKTY